MTLTAIAVTVALTAPLLAAGVVAGGGWNRISATAGVLAALSVLGSGIALASTVGRTPVFLVGHVLRTDALGAVMTLVVGGVATLAAIGSVSYVARELATEAISPARARSYGVLVNLFLAAMTLAVLANNLGVVWVAIETTTVATAFLVGHHGTRAALEATWKYVIICSLGIALAFLGTVLLYYASLHAGPASRALDVDSLVTRARHLDPGVTRLAMALLLLGYGAKVGLAPFHTWLADAHSQAPAPVSALMSGVLLAVALTTLLRLQVISRLALGAGFLRDGFLLLGLPTLLLAALLLVGQRDYKRMLAYSSLEQMGVLAVAAAAGTELALAALLLQVVGHGVAKAVLFLGSGHLQLAHDSTAIADVRGVLARSPVLGATLGIGLVTLLGLPPFALFPSEVAMAAAITRAHLTWALGVAFLLLLVAFAALARHGIAILLGSAPADAPRLGVPPAARTALVVGASACLVLGVSIGGFAHLLGAAGTVLAGAR